MKHSMNRRFEWSAALAALSLTSVLVTGCAVSPPDEERALPADPFPRWVTAIEVGLTDIDEVLDTFGAPKEMEDSQKGGTIWRYAHPEIHWSPNDPSRPQVAADGAIGPPREHPLEPVWDALVRAGEVIDSVIFFPPSQPRARKGRYVPATIHALEVAFRRDGTVDRFRYSPRPGRVRVAGSR